MKTLNFDQEIESYDFQLLLCYVFVERPLLSLINDSNLNAHIETRKIIVL